MDSPCIFLGIKVKPGPIERFKLENYTLDNTVDHLKTEAEKKSNVPSSSLEAIHHGKILKSDATLQDSGVKYGEMVHVVKKKQEVTTDILLADCNDEELDNLNTALRSLGCTPNAPGWTRAMQLLSEESVMNEILDVAPWLADDCVAISMLHEVELLAALATTTETMGNGDRAHPGLARALIHLMRLERARASTATTNDTGPAISGFAYSLEALSDEEDADDEEEEPDRNQITQEQFAAALQAATEAVSRGPASPDSSAAGAGGAGGAAPVDPGQMTLRELLRSAVGETSRYVQPMPVPDSAEMRRALITEAMFRQAMSSAMAVAVGSPRNPPSLNHSVFRPLSVPASAPAPVPGSMPASAPGSTTAPAAAAVPMDFTTTGASAVRAVTSPEATGVATSEAVNTASPPRLTPMDQSAEASSSQSPAPRDEDYSTQLNHMHEMGLLDDAVNVRALHICAGDVNAAINLVFSGAIGDEQ